MDDADTPSPNPVLGTGNSNRAPPGHSCRAPKDIHGCFELSASESVVDLRITAAGFAPAFRRVVSSGGTVVVALHPAEKRSGYVSAEGKPLAGATVHACADEDGNFDIVVTTDDSGRYELPDPDIWVKRVVIVHPEFPPSSGFPDRGVRGARFSLEHGAEVGGRIEGPAELSANAALSVNGLPAGKSAADGTFTIRATPSFKILKVRKGDFVGLSLNIMQTTITMKRQVVIRGRVFDQQSLQPLSNVLVLAQSGLPDEGSALTDREGRYEIRGLYPYAYALYVDVPGYDHVPRPLRSTDSISLMRLGEGAQVERDLLLARDSEVSGVVLDPNGNPLRGANVVITWNGVQQRSVHPHEDYRAECYTDSNGRFRRAFRSSRAVVTVFHDRYAPARSAPFVFGKGVGLDPIKGIVLDPIRMPEGRLLRGTVLDEYGNAVANARIVSVVRTEEEFDVAEIFTQRDLDADRCEADGTFAIPLPAGEVDIAVKAAGFQTAVRHNVDPARPLELRLEKSASLRGRVVTSDGRGVEGAQVALLVKRGIEATTSGTGEFRFDDVAPGLHEIAVQSDALSFECVTKAVAPSQDVVIQIPPRRFLVGRVIDKHSGDAPRLFTIYVWVYDSSCDQSLFSFAFLATDGRFSIPIPHEDVTLEVNAEGYESAEVELSAASSTEMTFELETTATLSGRITSDSGEPIDEVRVCVFEESEGGVSYGPCARSDAGGKFVLDGVTKASHVLRFERHAFVSLEREIDARSTREVNVVLSSGFKAEGVVVSLAGPASQAWVHLGDQRVKTDIDGRFSIAGLPAGTLELSVFHESGEASFDVEIPRGQPIPVILGKPPTGVLEGSLRGAPDGAPGVVAICSRERGNQETPILRDGKYRCEDVPVGCVMVQARIWINGVRYSANATATVRSEAPTQLDLELAPGEPREGCATSE